MASLFESKTCSRCGGSGHYSYCQYYGTTCFKCSGATVVLTKRGAAAQRLFTRLLSKPAHSLAPGDKFADQGGPFAQGIVTVISVTPETVKYAENGIDKSYPAVHIATDKIGFIGKPATEMVRVRVNNTTRQAVAAIALAYQAMLTKSGKEPKFLSTIAWG